MVKSGYPEALCSVTSRPISCSSSEALIPIVKSISLKTINDVPKTNINAASTPTN